VVAPTPNTRPELAAGRPPRPPAPAAPPPGFRWA
jgi:hypothetical protein